MAAVLRGVRAAIIDLDGTMLDTMGDFVVALSEMRAELGLGPVTAAQVEPMVGKGSENLVRRVLALDYDEAGVERLFPQAMESYQRHYIAINGQHSEVYDEVEAGLQAMRAAGLRLACVTNKPITFAQPLLAMKGLSGYFEVLYGGDSFEKKKPHPMPLLKACEFFGLPPAQVVAIGDSSNDAEAARAAGCPVLTVPYGYNHGVGIHETDSDGIVDTLLFAAELIAQEN
ncbi:phosphoglycolate phosphatase [Pseudoduganella sp. OTU4001]|uniref:phosphoglycolate phosphatase n=1 Tax=Pseudoduganella sp. OTU4001 TaxID=3043854 RepID=UPI00313A811D